MCRACLRWILGFAKLMRISSRYALIDAPEMTNVVDIPDNLRRQRLCGYYSHRGRAMDVFGRSGIPRSADCSC